MKALHFPGAFQDPRHEPRLLSGAIPAVARPNDATVVDLLKSLYVLASVVEARDPYTGGHLWRVSQYSRLLAEADGLPDSTVARISLGGFLHDLGKISVPDAILNKPDRLTEEEYAVIKTHPEMGSRLLGGHPLAAFIAPAILSHHETPDGLGYPLGISGCAIPLDARIVGICDAFDAMTSTRPYRLGMAPETTFSVIRENLGRQFDPVLGERFLALGQGNAFAPIVGYTEPGIPVQKCPLCGPTIVIHRRHRTGDTVYCRRCGSEAVLSREEPSIHLEPTGRRGTPTDLQPEADLDLIDELIQDAARGFLDLEHEARA